MQEVSTDQWIDIPGPVIDIYRLWRPTPLFRATRLEQALNTPARIYFKYEGVSPAGSHKPNTAVPQAYYNKEAGIRRIATETGAGQWGSSMAMACNIFGLACTVYMVKASYEQKPYRRDLHGDVRRRRAGVSVRHDELGPRDPRREHPDSTGSLGIAISEAVEDAATHDDTNYALGSVLGPRAPAPIRDRAWRRRSRWRWPANSRTSIIGCVGGGSNFAGISYPFMAGKLRGETPDLRFVATEPAACPTLTKGTFAYDYGDTAQIAPIVPMYTLGHDFVPAPVHAGGLRYHGDAPSLSMLVREGYMEAKAYTQNEIFGAAVQFAKTQGIIPAPEPAHAIRGAIDEAIEAREAGEAARDPVQPVRSRPLRHAGLRRLPERPSARGGVRSRRRGRGAREPARRADPGVARSGRSPDRRGAPAFQAGLPAWNSTEYAKRLAAQERGELVQVVAWDGERPVGKAMVLFPGHEECSVSAEREGCGEIRDVGVVRDHVVAAWRRR